MKTMPVKTGIHFLLTPEDSSAAPPDCRLQRSSIWWDRAKTVLWLVASVLMALLIGQL